MMMNKLRLIWLFVLGLGGTIVMAQDYNPISTATPFLTISPDSRGSALGDAGVATSPDLNSQYWNAAKYAFLDDDMGFSFSYTPWLRKLVNDIGLYYIVGHYKVDDIQSVSASIKYFSLGDIQWTDGTGTGLGTISPNEFALDAAYSRLFSEHISGGVTFRFIYSDLSGGAASGSSTNQSPGMAFATDLSIYYQKMVDWGAPLDFSLGLVASNVGSKISYNNGDQNYFLPATLRLGTGIGYQIDDYNRFNFTLDLSKLMVPTPEKTTTNDNENSTTNGTADGISVLKGVFSSFNDAPGGFSEELREVMVSVGGEYIYDNSFAIRAGYFHEHETKGNRKYASIGGGFKMNVMSLDFSYLIPMDNTSPLANTLRFSLSFGLEGIKTMFKQ